MKWLTPVIVLILQFIVSGCRTTDSVNGPIVPQPYRGMFILNEGAFPNAGTVAFYNRERDTVIGGVVGTSAGWVTPNDARVIAQKVYIAVTGSDAIKIVDAESFGITGFIQLPAGSGPGFLAANGSRLFVANNNGTLSIIDTDKDSLIATTPPILSFPGGIAQANGRIFISDIALWPNIKNEVVVLDAGSGAIVDTLHVDNNPGQMVIMNGRLFIVATGTSRLYKVDPSTLTIEDTLELGGYPGDIGTNGRSLFVLVGDNVLKISPDSLNVINPAFITRNGGLYFYAMAVDETNDEVVVSNVVSGGGLGQIEIYNASGALTRPGFVSGEFPGSFAFKR